MINNSQVSPRAYCPVFFWCNAATVTVAVREVNPERDSKRLFLFKSFNTVPMVGKRNYPRVCEDSPGMSHEEKENYDVEGDNMETEKQK